jgi:hypothetical protein
MDSECSTSSFFLNASDNDGNDDDQYSVCLTSSPYWEYLDSMVLKSQEEIRKEVRFLYEVSVPANNYKIVTGLSIARGIIPSVKLVNTILDVPENFISLDVIDWSEFLQHAIQLLKDTTNSGDESNKIIGTVEALSGNFQLLAVSFYDSVTLSLKSNNVTLCFCVKDIEALLRAESLVNFRIELLKQLDFKSFYNELLNYVNSIDIQNVNFFDIVRNICKLNTHEQSYLVLELIEFNPSKILSDFDKITINA